jgi:hypothetical protein
MIRIDVNVTPPTIATKVEERNVFFTCSISGTDKSHVFPVELYYQPLTEKIEIYR